MGDSTRTALLEEAQILLRTRGYADFSYADLSEKVAIRKASIHHHFPTKETLGLALVDGYLASFSEKLAAIAESTTDAASKLRAYSQFFISAMDEQQLPLCGALAAQFRSLPDSMGQRTREFFDLHIGWLTGIISEGVAAGTFGAKVDPAAAALLLLSVLEGASLIVWVTGSGTYLPEAFEAALKTLF